MLRIDSLLTEFARCVHLSQLFLMDMYLVLFLLVVCKLKGSGNTDHLGLIQ